MRVDEAGRRVWCESYPLPETPYSRLRKMLSPKAIGFWKQTLWVLYASHGCGRVDLDVCDTCCDAALEAALELDGWEVTRAD